MAEKGVVKLFGLWCSPISLRAEWALMLKGVEYEHVEEDLQNKSDELLRYNPVTKKIPVLVHDGKAMAESLVIIEYVDEVWKDGYPIMPKDPYERAQARFWAKYAEDKVAPATFAVYSTVGVQQQQQALQEARESFKTLEEALKGKKFFGRETVGFVDIVAGWLACWVRVIEEIVGVNIVNENDLPLINAWFDNFMELELVKGSLPPKDKLYAVNKARREKLLA